MVAHHERHSHYPTGRDFSPEIDGSSRALAWVLGLVVLAVLLVTSSWLFAHGLLLLAGGLLMLWYPGKIRTSAWWWMLLVFAVLSLAQFLPVGMAGIPEWRLWLERRGVRTGGLAVVQSRMAAEYFTIFLGGLVIALWATGHAPGKRGLWRIAITFVMVVACYAAWARWNQPDIPSGSNEESHYGLFPNRNHTACLLALGGIVALGGVIQGVRDRSFPRLGIMLVCGVVPVVSLVLWSVSRAGVVLFVIGCGIWMVLVGPRYLGTHGRKMIGLISVAVVGVFLLTDSRVKERLAESIRVKEQHLTERTGKGPAATTHDLEADHAPKHDMRVLTAMDTWEMIREFPVTGVGSGQFRFVFPLYRQRTVMSNDAFHYHPESDWLWLAAEHGLPAALCLLGLVGWILVSGFKELRFGDARALRAACLTGAAMVATHGIFDVPGHRVPLLWLAAWLYACSRDPLAQRIHPTRGVRSMGRLLAIPVVGIGLLALVIALRAPRQSSVLLGGLAQSEARQAMERRLELLRAARETGEPMVLSANADPMTPVWPELDRAVRILPLDCEVRETRAESLIQTFRDLPMAANDFTVIDHLSPTNVVRPLLHGMWFARVDPFQTGIFWRESIRRAKWLDANHPGTQFGEKSVREKIDSYVAKSPLLQSLKHQLDQE